MEYEYKSIILVKSGYIIEEKHRMVLQQYFDTGWEYVNSIIQTGRASPGIMIILKKEKTKIINS